MSCQNEKSQLQNKEQALRILRARLLAAAQDEADAEASEARRSQVRTVDRSERIRTYNYPENRISDHRTGYKAYNLDQVLDGDLQPVIDSCLEADLAARLDAVEADGALSAGPTPLADDAVGPAARGRGGVPRPRRPSPAGPRARGRALPARRSWTTYRRPPPRSTTRWWRAARRASRSST